MADNNTTVNIYNMLLGVNTKASEYAQQQAGFRDLRNLDFYQPNALSKRPGSTNMVATGTSGPITSLFEFQKLNGASYVIAGSDTAMFYMAANAYTLLSSGWNNGQPTDMLTFQDKLWMANGQKFENWNGSTPAVRPGLPCQPLGFTTQLSTGFVGASIFTVGGATMTIMQGGLGNAFLARGVYVAYSYVRSDGYQGPVDFLQQARNVIYQGPANNGDEYFYGGGAQNIQGITVPNGLGISAINIWVAVDTVRGITNAVGPQYSLIGDLGWAVPSGTSLSTYFLSMTLKPDADISRFWLNRTISAGNTTPGNGTDFVFVSSSNGVSFWTAQMLMGLTAGVNIATFNSYTGPATPGYAFSGMPFCYFDTYTPKYIDVSNNVLFSSGFSNVPSTIQFSEIGQPEVTSPDYNFEVRTNDGDKITGQKTYNNQVIVTKERSFHKIIGSTPDDLQLVEISTEFGCLSNKTMVEVDQKLMWLDKRGILEFNGSSWQIISTPVEPIFRRMNLAAADKACAVNHQYRNQVWFGIPIDGSTSNNITVVYDYLVGAWTFFDGFSPASLALVKGPLSTPTAWYGDYSGVVHAFGESFFADAGRGITCLGVPNWESGPQNETHIWRRFFLDVAPNTSALTGTISTKIFANYDQSTVQATFAMYQSQYQSRADFGVPAKSVTAEFAHYSASLPLVIKGFSWTKRFLRNV